MEPRWADSRCIGHSASRLLLQCVRPCPADGCLFLCSTSKCAAAGRFALTREVVALAAAPLDWGA